MRTLGLALLGVLCFGQIPAGGGGGGGGAGSGTVTTTGVTLPGEIAGFSGSTSITGLQRYGVDAFAAVTASNAVWLGAWSSVTTYVSCNAVSYMGQNWLATGGSQNITPGSSYQSWTEIGNNQASFTPQLYDCGFAGVLAAAAVAGANKTLELGDGSYTTSACPVEPLNSAFGVNLEGVGFGSSRGGVGGPSQIITNNSCGRTNAVFQDPNGKSGGLRRGAVVTNVTFNANNLAQGCADFSGELYWFYQNIYCYNGGGSDHWMSFGPGSGDALQQGTMINVKAVFLGNPSSSWASVTAAGATATLTVNTPGTYASFKPNAVIHGTGSSMNPGNPCDVMGTIAVVMAGTGPFTVASATSSGFSGCSGTMYAEIQDEAPNSNYGIVFGLFTDNQVYSVESQGIGRIAGVRVEHGNNRFYGSSSQSSEVCWLDQAPETNYYFGIKFDSCFHYGFESVNGKGSLSGASFVWNDNYAGAGGYLFDSAATNFALYSSSCVSNQTAGGYNLFVSKSGGVLSGFDSTSLLASIPGLRLSNVGACDGTGNSFDLTPIPILYSAAGTALPTCNSGAKGLSATVSDATFPVVYGATYASGGAVVSRVQCNGSNWVTQ